MGKVKNVLKGLGGVTSKLPEKGGATFSNYNIGNSGIVRSAVTGRKYMPTGSLEESFGARLNIGGKKNVKRN